MDPQEVVQFLKENPHLDKKMIGEYISSRSNLNVLDTYVKWVYKNGDQYTDNLSI